MVMRDDDEGVVPLEARLNRLLLERAQLGEPPVAAHCGEDVGGGPACGLGHALLTTIRINARDTQLSQE